MGRIEDTFDTERREPDEASVRCKRCGQTGLVWRNVISPDGRRDVPTLVDDRMRKHVCQARADDFDEIEA